MSEKIFDHRLDHKHNQSQNATPSGDFKINFNYTGVHNDQLSSGDVVFGKGHKGLDLRKSTGGLSEHVNKRFIDYIFFMKTKNGKNIINE